MPSTTHGDEVGNDGMHRAGFYLCLFYPCLIVGVVFATACGRTASDEQRRPPSGGDDEPETPSDTARSSMDALLVACEAACDWARECCVSAEGSCSLNDCEEACLLEFDSGSTATCKRLAGAALECFAGTACDATPSVACVSEQDAFEREGCEPEGSGESSELAPAMSVPDATDPLPAATLPDMEPNPAPVVDGDGPPVRSTDGPAFATVSPTFERACTASCHEPGGVLGGPGGAILEAMHDLTAVASYETLTTRRSLQVPSMWLVGSGLDDSYLWHKLQGTHETVGGSGLAMPLTGELTSAELDAIRAWIEGGASR